MEKYYVNVDITMSKTIQVEADSEDDAIRKVDNMISKNPYDYTSDFSHYVTHEVIDVETD